MISLSLAYQLKTAGLTWTPAHNDFFQVPGRGLDDTRFVISDMAILVEKLHGQLAVTFHGTPEWALDHIVVSELVWCPTETQVRQILERHLISETQPALQLLSQTDGYQCRIKFNDTPLSFDAFGASDAYGLALLHILQQI